MVQGPLPTTGSRMGTPEPPCDTKSRPHPEGSFRDKRFGRTPRGCGAERAEALVLPCTLLWAGPARAPAHSASLPSPVSSTGLDPACVSAKFQWSCFSQRPGQYLPWPLCPPHRLSPSSPPGRNAGDCGARTYGGRGGSTSRVERAASGCSENSGTKKQSGGGGQVRAAGTAAR
jgi:hypothetical protein